MHSYTQLQYIINQSYAIVLCTLNGSTIARVDKGEYATNIHTMAARLCTSCITNCATLGCNSIAVWLLQYNVNVVLEQPDNHTAIELDSLQYFLCLGT